ncbi:hypothetical protein C8Q74DRAFT_1310645 [Fomes fomentarius]|nr:hypothetical protein C8Q74DRAFT_1310645 [Fomes fomentarius]
MEHGGIMRLAEALRLDKDYYRFVYKWYRIKLVRWDPWLLFVNLSELTGLLRISRLAALWESGVLHFERVSDEEFEAARNRPILVAPSPRNHGCASGFGSKNTKKRLVCAEGYSPRYERNGPKSQKVVTAEAEEWAAQGMELEEDPITWFSDDESPSRLFRNARAGWSGTRPGRITTRPLFFGRRP